MKIKKIYEVLPEKAGEWDGNKQKKAPQSCNFEGLFYGGRGEIRTHGRLASTTVFKTVALNHSATLP